MSLLEFGQNIKETVAQWVGLSVCVGIAPTKTLAKLANHAAKKSPATDGVVDLTQYERQQQIMCSRSFGSRITTLEQMSEAIAQYTARAAEKLRQENQQAKMLTIFVQTSQFKESHKTYSNSATGELILPSSDTRELNVLAMRLLKRVWREGYSYSKGGVMLSDFYDNDAYQPGLFDDVEKRPNSTKLMAVLDEINQSGLGKVFLARQGMQNTWQMKREHLSPAYTTRWSDLPRVN